MPDGLVLIYWMILLGTDRFGANLSIDLVGEIESQEVVYNKRCNELQ